METFLHGSQTKLVTGEVGHALEEEQFVRFAVLVVELASLVLYLVAAEGR